MNTTTRLRRVGLLLAAATITIASAYAVAQKPKPPARRKRPSRPELKVGQVAPDVELAPLEFEKNEKGEIVPKIGEKKIKLSTFKGKAPVCIFSSSYT
jgi:hypothetical protein